MCYECTEKIIFSDNIEHFPAILTIRYNNFFYVLKLIIYSYDSKIVYIIYKILLKHTFLIYYYYIQPSLLH